MGLQVHILNRSRNLVNSLCTIGVVCIIIELENMLADAVSTHFEPNLLKEFFTVGAFNNIYHNPSSISAQVSFHRTGMSVFQFPTASNFGIEDCD